MICDEIQKLMDYGLQNDLIQLEDRYVVQNQYMEIFQLNDWQTSGDASSKTEIDAILQPLIDYACAQHLIPDTSASRDLFDTRLMGVLNVRLLLQFVSLTVGKQTRVIRHLMALQLQVI